MAWRKARPVEDVVNDPAFSYHIGQLIGAMQMAGYVLSMHEDPKVVEIGKRLWETSGWFLEPDNGPPSTASEQDTRRMPAITAPKQ